MNVNQIANIGMLIGEPARTHMILALMDLQALTATELARVANITPQTASAHLARLTEAGLLSVQKQGRHRYHKIASPEVARMIEAVLEVAAVQQDKVKPVVTGPSDEAMRKARSCYDHFAGRLGVRITDSLIERGHLAFNNEAGEITKSGLKHLARFGIEPNCDQLKRKSRRPICRPCLDWSERRPHVAGIVGRAISHHFFEQNLVKRIHESRALRVTPKGQGALSRMFGISDFK